MDLKTTLAELQCELVAERNLVTPKAISWLQYDILCQIKKEKEVLPSHLSLMLGLSRTKLSKALKELKTMSYIAQRPNKSDGRKLSTFLTDEGAALLASISQKHTALYETAVKAFTKEEQDRFILLAHTLAKALRKERIEKDE